MIGLDGVSAQELSDTIGAIYDCAIDPDGWRDTFRMVAGLCDSAAGGMCVHDLKHEQNDSLYMFGYPAAFPPLYQKYLGDSPFTAAASLMTVGDVGTLAMLCSDEELFESRFYRELLKEFGYLDYIGFLALRTGSRIASVHTCRTDRAPRYGQREVNLFKLLSPHICRALAISDALDIRTVRTEMLEATLNGLAAGVYLTAQGGRVVYMNTAAERQIKSGSALGITNNRLSPTDPQARSTLAKAIDDVARDETDAGTAGNSVAIPDADGGGYVATLLPLERGRRQAIIAPFAAYVAVFTQDPAQVPLMPGEAFAKLYRLTGGELRVLLAIAQGLGAKEAAEMIGIGEPTVRTHLQRIFSKTATAKQTELLGLFLRTVPPIGAS